MAGMLKSYSFIGADGYKTNGTQKLYQGKAAGYNTNPTDMIAYVDKHDNEALFDWLTYKLPIDATKAQRLRYQVIGMALPTLGQGVPFWQAGSDIMRSKSLDKNSYNSGDWFNAIDWSMQDNGFGRGLPMKGDNGARWEEFAQPLLAKAADIKPTQADMMASTARFQDFLKVRYSSPLFRLGTGKEVQARVRSVTPSGNTPGVLAIQYLDGTAKIKSLKDLDKKYRSVVIVINMNKSSKSVTFARDTTKAALHPVLAAGNDPTVKTAKIKATTKKVGKKVNKNWTATVPGLTAAVFVTY
jgi:pullulanase/glycogen debranching enzyme